MSQKIAVFDVDGTLYGGNLGIEFLKVLIANNIFNPEVGKEIFGWYAKYKSGEVEKTIVVDEIYRLFAVGMTGVDQSISLQTAHETFEKVKINLFSFAPELLSTLISSGYKVILLSGSPVEMISELGKLLGLENDLIIGGELEVIDNKYTGNIISYPGSADQKVSIIKRKIDELHLDIDWPNSFGMGDNERDIGILKLVGHPIAFTPNSVLSDIATQNNWQIATKDNVIPIFSANLI